MARPAFRGELLGLAWGAIVAHRLRSSLTTLGISIGVAAVILLTSIGEGTRRFVLDEFAQFGTNIIAINPGNTKTSGAPGALAGTVRKLTLADAEAVARIPGVEHVVPVVMGMARVEREERGRSVLVYGVSSELPAVWKIGVRQGAFLPEIDLARGAPLVALGPTLKREIFADDNALGQYVRIGGFRFQVIGVMEPKGLILGWDMDDSAYIPVASAQRVFNRDGLIEIDLSFAEHLAAGSIARELERVLIARHGGEEDFTVTTQTEMLDVLDRVMAVVSLAVGGIGAISLVVGAIGILTMMWISVSERTTEIGLVRAIGAGAGQVLALFLLEAALLSLVGGVLGVAVGIGLARAIRLALPGFPVYTPALYVVVALLLSLAVGLASGALPARRAAALDPVRALRAE
ncbi:MAG TPA: ABC transporter permease [Candidatus Polarisedimenticolaceae bacterium]|nr:ABC transporter permease [Candidatus Polarisedimenticolaceae bacterium]